MRPCRLWPVLSQGAPPCARRSLTLLDSGVPSRQSAMERRRVRSLQPLGLLALGGAELGLMRAAALSAPRSVRSPPGVHAAVLNAQPLSPRADCLFQRRLPRALAAGVEEFDEVRDCVMLLATLHPLPQLLGGRGLLLRRDLRVSRPRYTLPSAARPPLR